MNKFTETFLTIDNDCDSWGDTNGYDTDELISSIRTVAGEFGLTEETEGLGYNDAFVIHTPDIDVVMLNFGRTTAYKGAEIVEADEINWFEPIYCSGIAADDLDAIRDVFASQSAK
jgi:hypothetical protein